MSASHWTVVFDGTDARPLGRLLFPPTLPRPVTTPARVSVRVTCRTEPKLSRPVQARLNAAGGEVAKAKDHLWQLLEFPRTSHELIHALGLPKNALATAMALAVRSGVLVTAGHRKNEIRTPGIRLWSRLYQRAPKYATATRWPYVRMTRAQQRERAA